MLMSLGLFKSEAEVVHCRECGVGSDTAFMSWPHPRYWKAQTNEEYEAEVRRVASYALCEYCQFGIKMEREC